MLVSYSSSEEEEEQPAEEKTNHQNNSKHKFQEKNGDKEDFSPRKKQRTKDLIPSKKLPLPGCLLTMFPEDEDTQTEDSSLHGGRIRSFKHERGNWATYVYLPYHAEEEFEELLDELLSSAATRGVALTQQEEFHLSLSQTVVLRHHWIQPFTQKLKTSLNHKKRFVCSAGRLKVYCNAEKTRTFLGMEVSTGHAQLLDLVRLIDETMVEFQLDTFYKEPSFHVSLAWCVGDQTEKIKEFLPELQVLVDQHDGGPFLLTLDCAELRCRTGNKTFCFPLKL